MILPAAGGLLIGVPMKRQPLPARSYFTGLTAEARHKWRQQQASGPADLAVATCTPGDHGPP